METITMQRISNMYRCQANACWQPHHGVTLMLDMKQSYISFYIFNAVCYFNEKLINFIFIYYHSRVWCTGSNMFSHVSLSACLVRALTSECIDLHTCYLVSSYTLMRFRLRSSIQMMSWVKFTQTHMSVIWLWLKGGVQSCLFSFLFVILFSWLSYGFCFQYLFVSVFSFC